MFRRRRRSYRPRRFYIRRRPRYYPSPLRTQMNDAETRTMSFTQSMDISLTVGVGVQGISSAFTIDNILAGSSAQTPMIDSSSGRIFHAGMMYDRYRLKYCSVQIRPKIMPAATGVPNYTFHIAWDRYYNDLVMNELLSNPRVVTDDPSAKMIIWSPGGNASTLSHYIYSLPKDRYQYIMINHGGSESWTSHPGNGPNAFCPSLRYVLDLGYEQTNPITIRVIFQFRFTLEFMGAASCGVGTDHGPIPTSKFQVTTTPLPSSAFNGSLSSVRSSIPVRDGEDVQSQPLPAVRSSRWQSS